MFWAVPLVFLLIFVLLFVSAIYSPSGEKADSDEDDWWRAIK
ncbi:hypothetical protein [Bradyrhizobium sp. Ai1a-2]|nr:hypothetical protein [Bradyrhizobium sp. Ai1a-2]